MIKVYTESLSGMALNWAVMTTINATDGRLAKGLCLYRKSDNSSLAPFNPQGDWALTGPLLEQYEIYPMAYGGRTPTEKKFRYEAGIDEHWMLGSTMLEAACRAIVAKTQGLCMLVPKGLATLCNAVPAEIHETPTAELLDELASDFPDGMLAPNAQ